MDRSFKPTEWKPQETAGKHWQVGMPFMSEVPTAQLLAWPVVAKASFSGCLIEAARHCGMEDQHIADKINISHGYMSKFMRGVGQRQMKRLVAFMHVTKSLAPLQWLAFQMGCRVVVQDDQSRELAEARARVAELERQERMAA